MPAWVLALACLPAGFAVAEVTGVRALGGLVLVAMGLLTLRAAATSWPRATAWSLVALACFAASHAVADVLGSWGAVAAAAAVTGAAGAVLLRPPGSAPTWRGTPRPRAARGRP